MKAFAFILAVMVVSGCRQGPKPDKGLAALRVSVIAEPKVGVKPPPDDAASKASYGPFSRIDYAQIDHIVVWLEPGAGNTLATTTTSPLTVTVDPLKSSHGIDAVVCVGQKIIVKNAGPKAQDIYSASDGNDFDLPSVAPSGVGEYIVRAPGFIEIFADTSKDIAVQLYAAPTPWAQLARAGETVDFNNIPPGHYQVFSWHHRLPGTSAPVRLAADSVTHAAVKVGVNSLPKIGP